MKENEHHQSVSLTERLLELRKRLRYDEKTGAFYWVKPFGTRHQVGDKAGWIDPSKGYNFIHCRGYTYRAASLAWYFVHGEYTKVDHKDRNKANDQITNLRKCTHQENMANQNVRCNNLLGIKGVQKRHRKYRAYITINGETIRLGTFKKLIDAISARREAAELYHGEFSNG